MPKINWEKQFNKKFLETCLPDCNERFVVEDIKSFIRQLLEEERERIREKTIKGCENNIHEWSNSFGEQSTTIFRSCLRCGKKNPNWETMLQGGTGGSSQNN